MTARLPRAVWFVCVLTAARLIPTSARQEVKYLKLGGTLEVLPDITPVTTEPITGIMWKHGQNKAAEWDKEDGPDVDYYGTYKNRTLLNKNTFKLVVQNMTIRDGGIYSLEINGRMQGHTFKTEFIVDVPKPEVDLKPLTCTPDSPHCLLVCQGNIIGAGPVTYRWKTMNGEVKWKPSDSAQLNISKTEEGKTIKTYSCEMKNPVGEKLSEPYENLFYVPPPPISVTGLVLGVGLPLLLLAGLLISVKTSKTIRNWIPPTVRDRLPGPLKRCFFPEVTAGATNVGDGDKPEEGNGVTAGATTVHVGDGDKPEEGHGVTAGATTVHVGDGDKPEEGHGVTVPLLDVPTSNANSSDSAPVTAGSTTVHVGDADTPEEGHGVTVPLLDVPTSNANSSDSAPVTAGATTVHVGDADTPEEGHGGSHS